MGYLFLLIALLCGTAKGFCGKKVSVYTKEYSSAMLSNIVRMLFCVAIGFFFVIFDGGFSQFKVSPEILLISLFSGLCTSVFVVSWLLSVRQGAYMLVDVFLTVGVVIPIIMSAIIYQEKIKYTQIIGLVILFVAVLIMCSYNNQIKIKISLPSLILLIIVGVSNGFADFSQKMFTKTTETTLASTFNFYTYVFSALVLIFLFTVTKRGKSEFKESFVTVKHCMVYVIIMAVCLFANSYFKTLSATYLKATELYPLNQGSALILSTLMSAFFFGEKIKPKCIVSIVLTFIGLIMINVL